MSSSAIETAALARGVRVTDDALMVQLADSREISVPGREVTLFTENQFSSCQYEFQQGKTYLVFARLHEGLNRNQYRACFVWSDVGPSEVEIVNYH